MVTLLLLALTLARAQHPAAPFPLQIPVVPSAEGGVRHYGTFAPLPAGANATDPWVSDVEQIICKTRGDTVEVSMALDPASWPYALPEKVQCVQGNSHVEVALKFREPEASIWRAADGTVVIPHHEGSFQMGIFTVAAAPDPSAAALASAVPGVSCEARPTGQLVVNLDDKALAGEAVCRVTTADGRILDQKIVVQGY